MANFAELFDRRVDPRNRIYYWMDGKKAELEEGEDVDFEEKLAKDKLALYQLYTTKIAE